MEIYFDKKKMEKYLSIGGTRKVQSALHWHALIVCQLPQVFQFGNRQKRAEPPPFLTKEDSRKTQPRALLMGSAHIPEKSI